MGRLIPVYGVDYCGRRTSYPSHYVEVPRYPSHHMKARQTGIFDILCGLFAMLFSFLKMVCNTLMPVCVWIACAILTILGYMCDKTIEWVEAGGAEKLFRKIFTLFQMLFRIK